MCLCLIASSPHRLIAIASVSCAAAGKAEPCFSSSIRSSVGPIASGGAGESLLFLGLDAAAECRVALWFDRVTALIERGGLWIQALGYALDCFEGTAQVAIGLPRDKKLLKATIMERMVELYVAPALPWPSRSAARLLGCFNGGLHAHVFVCVRAV